MRANTLVSECQLRSQGTNIIKGVLQLNRLLVRTITTGVEPISSSTGGVLMVGNGDEAHMEADSSLAAFK